MKQLPGFFYDARKKRAVFDGYVPGTHGRARRFGEGLRGDSGPHDLRHTFGCRLASNSVSLQIIAKALGHTTRRMADGMHGRRRQPCTPW